MIQSLRIFAALAIVLWQNPLIIEPFTSSDISLEIFDPTVHRAFAERMRRPESAHFLPTAVVLTNRYPHAIVALGVKWTTASGGQVISTAFQPSDSFLYNTAPVVPVGSQVLLHRSGSMSAAVPQGRGLISGVLGGAIRPSSSDPIQMTMTLDTVIFADGLVIGPDQNQLAVSLIRRRATAETFVKTVRSAIEEGQDVTGRLESMSRSRPNPDDPWTNSFARSVLASLRSTGDTARALNQLANLPQLPQFRRN